MTPLHTDLEELLRLAKECATDVIAAADGIYTPELREYPSEQRRYERDTADARALLDLITRHGPQLAALVGENAADRLNIEAVIKRSDQQAEANCALRAELAAKEKRIEALRRGLDNIINGYKIINPFEAAKLYIEADDKAKGEK